MSRKLGRNDPCWCGSGLKYKRCHLYRDRAEPLRPSEALAAIKKAFGKRYCLHPQASPQNCHGNIVRAHTIQRGGGLTRIAEEGHVYNCLVHRRRLSPASANLQPTLVGINKASTFTGFCALHDNEAFAPIEDQPFQSIPEHAFLLAYRAISSEVFLKKASLELASLRRSLDRGRSLREQVLIQQFAEYFDAGLTKGLEELEELKTLCDDILLRNEYSDVKYYIIRLRDPPEIMCNAVHQPEYDFQGNVLQQLDDLDESARYMHFSLIATDDGGAAVFSWTKERGCPEFIMSLHALSDDEMPHAVVRYVFEFFENTYFSPVWWDSLAASTQRKLIQRQLTELPPRFEYPRDRTCLQDDGIRAVNWEIVSRDTNLSL
jgi:hypothetical protein